MRPKLKSRGGRTEFGSIPMLNGERIRIMTCARIPKKPTSCVSVYKYMYIYRCVYTYIQIHIVYSYIYICIYTYMSICIQPCIHTYIYMYIYIHVSIFLKSAFASAWSCSQILSMLCVAKANHSASSGSRTPSTAATTAEVAWRHVELICLSRVLALAPGHGLSFRSFTAGNDACDPKGAYGACWRF